MNRKEDARMYQIEGQSAIRRDSFKRAGVIYSRAMLLNQNDFYSSFGRARVFWRREKYKEASILYKRVILINSKYSAAYYNLALVFDRLGKFDESLEMYKKTICLDPLDANAYQNSAVLLRIKGEYEEARKHYMKTLELRPSDAYLIANGLGCLHFMQGMLAKAMEEFQKSIELNGKFVYAYCNMSLVLFCKEKNKEAEKYFEDGMKLLVEEKEKISTIKDITASYIDLKTRFEAKLDEGDEFSNERQMFRIMIDGLTTMINLLIRLLGK